MRIKVWGTRDSIAVCNPESVRAGGNTTCFEVISDCLPRHTRLMIDAGTGFGDGVGQAIPLSIPCGE